MGPIVACWHRDSRVPPRVWRPTRAGEAGQERPRRDIVGEHTGKQRESVLQVLVDRTELVRDQVRLSRCSIGHLRKRIRSGQVARSGIRLGFHHALQQQGVCCHILMLSLVSD